MVCCRCRLLFVSSKARTFKGGEVGRLRERVVKSVLVSAQAARWAGDGRIIIGSDVVGSGGELAFLRFVSLHHVQASSGGG